MKLYYSILTVLTCYGCASQQPKDDPYTPQDTQAKIDTRQVIAPEQSVSKVTQVSPPQTNLATSTETKANLPTSTETKAKVSKTKETKAIKVKTVKTSPSVSKARQVNTPQTSVKTNISKHKVKTAPKQTKDIALELKKRVEDESSHSSSNKMADSKAAQTSTAKTNIKSSSDSLKTEIPSIKSNHAAPMDSVKAAPGQTSYSRPSDSVVATIITPQTELDTSTEKQVIEDPATKLSTVDFHLEKLPLDFGGSWSLDRNHDKISKTTRCLLNSQKKKFNDGYTDSFISLQLSADTLLINTNSAIDLTYPDIGIYIDQNAPFPLEKLFGETSILIKQNTQKITSQLVAGEKLTIKLGFWPTWPKTETHSIDFALSDFDQAYQYFQACEKL